MTASRSMIADSSPTVPSGYAGAESPSPAKSANGGTRPRTEPAGIAICLSGAGLRAALFQAGALRRLNELGLLGRADIISAVAGGSLVAAVLGKAWNQLRADARGALHDLETHVLSPLEKFAEQSFRGGSGWGWLSPTNWVSVRERSQSEQLARHLERRLLRRATTAKLPTHPRFAFSATNPITGSLWRFERDRIGESLLGYSNQEVRLSDVVVASAVSPPTYPPLRFRLEPNRFGDGLLGPRADRLRKRTPLMDGSLRDPLAVEDVWRETEVVVAIDGGRPMSLDPDYEDWVGDRLLRGMEIARDQSHEAHQRWFVSTIEDGSRQGAYIGLATYHGHYGVPGSVGYPRDVVEEINLLEAEPTRLTPAQSRTLANHGFTLADVAVRRYLPNLVDQSAPLSLPYDDYVDRGRVLSGLGTGVGRAA